MDFKVGDVVYKGFSPATVGIVVKVEKKDWDFHANMGMAPFLRNVSVLTVRKANGQTWEQPQGYVEDFRKLIEDHRRKLERHEAALIKLLNAS